MGGRALGIFSSKLELNNKIKDLQEDLQKKKLDNNRLTREVTDIKSQLEYAVKLNKDYEAKYINTNLECEFCYKVLQEDYEYCPKCGQKIIKKNSEVFTEPVKALFKLEPDGDYFLINQYIGFNDKKIVIPSSRNGRPILGIWN